MRDGKLARGIGGGCCQVSNLLYMLALLGGMKILVPMAGLIDVAAERARLRKRRDKVAAETEKITAKLANESFVSRAPEDVVAKERGRQADLQRDLSQLDEQIAKLGELE